MNLPLILLLAQMCVAEIGFTDNPDECRLMWHIMRAKPGLLSDNVRRYNSYFRGAWGKRSRPYIQHLTNDPRQEPAEWDSTSASWDNHMDAWASILGAAIAFAAAPGKHPCPDANHYGGGMDTVPTCWERQWCGEPRDFFRQRYWRSNTCSGVVSAKVASGR